MRTREPQSLMSFLSIVLLLLTCVHSTSWSGPNRGGMLVVHDASATYSASWEIPVPTPLMSCEDVDSELPRGLPPDGDGYVWKVYAAFPSDTSPRLKATCFGASFPPSVTVTAAGLLSIMDFEVPTSGWPYLTEYGTMMSFGETKTAHLSEIYWIAGYGDEGGWKLIRHPTQVMVFVDDSWPPIEDQIVALGSIGFGVPGDTYCPDANPPGACCLPGGICEISTRPECEAQFGIFRGPNFPCVPSPCNAGACCMVSGECFQITEDECGLGSGLWTGEMVPCNPNPCPPLNTVCCHAGVCHIWPAWNCEATGGVAFPELTECFPNPCPPQGACCLPDGSCVLEVEPLCVEIQGQWQPGGCTPNPCHAFGACCLPDGSCEVLSDEECVAQSGSWYGAWTTCEWVSCEPTPIERTTWGRIKQSYR